jgi:hypothetical protein
MDIGLATGETGFASVEFPWLRTSKYIQQCSNSSLSPIALGGGGPNDRAILPRSLFRFAAELHRVSNTAVSSPIAWGGGYRKIKPCYLAPSFGLRRSSTESPQEPRIVLSQILDRSEAVLARLAPRSMSITKNADLIVTG